MRPQPSPFPQPPCPSVHPTTAILARRSLLSRFSERAYSPLRGTMVSTRSSSPVSVPPSSSSLNFSMFRRTPQRSSGTRSLTSLLRSEGGRRGAACVKYDQQVEAARPVALARSDVGSGQTSEHRRQPSVWAGRLLCSLALQMRS